MTKPVSVRVKVPASTANLGPGFDCLGLALDIWNEIEFKNIGDSLKIEIIGEGSKTLPRDRNNLIYKAMQALAEHASLEMPEGISITCQNDIPISSGLGSSSAAVIAGLIGAKNLLNINICDRELLKIALSFEGHADNISACLFGGLVIATFINDEILINRVAIQPINAIVAIPNINLSTIQAREALPVNIPFKDAVFNIGRTAMLVNALLSENHENLIYAMQDQIHQSFRYKLIPGAENAISSALNAGAIGAALSGAGPSVIAFYKHDESIIREALLNVYNETGLPVRIISTTSTNQAAFIIKK